jgi:hypothetical protein
MAGLQSPEPADVAQLVEHWLPKPRVVGSSPIVRFCRVGTRVPVFGAFLRSGGEPPVLSLRAGLPIQDR